MVLASSTMPSNKGSLRERLPAHNVSDRDQFLDAMVDEVGSISIGSSFHCHLVDVASIMDMACTTTVDQQWCHRVDVASTMDMACTTTVD
jgi:hypothetical protein